MTPDKVLIGSSGIEPSIIYDDRKSEISHLGMKSVGFPSRNGGGKGPLSKSMSSMATGKLRIPKRDPAAGKKGDALLVRDLLHGNLNANRQKSKEDTITFDMRAFRQKTLQGGVFHPYHDSEYSEKKTASDQLQYQKRHRRLIKHLGQIPRAQEEGLDLL